MSARERLAIVQLPISPLGPRARRAAFLSTALAAEWEVVRWPPASSPGALDENHRSSGRSLTQQAAASVLLDRHELTCRRALSRFPTELSAAVLVGPPFSPVALASARLSAARRGVPYVIDVGDPWALTAAKRSGSPFRRRRARRAEHQAWAAAAGAIVTTRGQSDALQALFPGMPVLIRPNGYEPVEAPEPTSRLGSPTLRIVYYGSFYDSFDPAELCLLCERLLASGHWREVSLTQYGRDWNRTLSSLPRGIQARQKSPVTWEEIVRSARDFDVALVVGHADRRQLPSKAIQYLTLPIPRLALCGGPDNALAQYVADKSGFLLASPEDKDLPDRIKAHVERSWTTEQLAAPASESWDAVAPAIAQFVTSYLRA
jgi:hypothetical protein